MTANIDRREFLRLAGYGGVAFASGLGLPSCASYGSGAGSGAEDFYFVQLSDTHWGYEGPGNADPRGTLPRAIEAINGMAQAPDFVVFTGDLTHITQDAATRRERMTQFRDVCATLKVRDIHFLPGEHDASLDRGEIYQEFFGKPYYAFDHKGLHFLALDNVSDPQGSLGDAQLAWVADDLRQRPLEAPIVVFTHRPLFDLAPSWGWATADAERVIALLRPFARVTVFYGHIHQEHHHVDGNIAQHAARSLIFPLPAPGSADHKPVAWDPAHPYRGVGWRLAEAGVSRPVTLLTEVDVR